MNPFFINSALIFDHFEAVARAHERMFDMMNRDFDHSNHYRNVPPQRNAITRQRSNFIERDDIQNSRSFSGGYRRASTGSHIIENRANERISRFPTQPSRAVGVRRQDTLAREGIKPLANAKSFDTGEKGSMKRTSMTKTNDDVLGDSMFKSSNHLGQGWYCITSLESGAVSFRGSQTLLESVNRFTALLVFNPGKSQDTCHSVTFQSKLLPESENMISMVLGYHQSSSFFILHIDVLQKTVSLHSLSTNTVPLTFQAFRKQSTIIWQEGMTSSGTELTIVNHRFYKYQIEITKNRLVIQINGVIVFEKNDYDETIRSTLSSTSATLKTSDDDPITDLSNGYFGFLLFPNQQIYLKEIELRGNTSLSNPVLSNNLNIATTNKQPPPQRRPVTAQSKSNSHPTATAASSLAIESSEKGTLLLEDYENKKTINHQEQLKKRLLELKYDSNIVDAILQDMLIEDNHNHHQSNKRITFEEIAGLHEPKRILNEAILLPFIMPEYFTGIISESWKGILLFGPAGTGKTLLAKAIASYHHYSFFNCSIANLISKWRGESEKLIKCLFEIARLASPSIIFFDEIDALVSSRNSDNEHEASRRMKTEIFSQMDGLQSSSSLADGKARVLVLATTNCPWDLDTAMLRRLEKRVYIPLPDELARQQHFELCLKTMNLQFNTVDLEDSKEMEKVSTEDRRKDLIKSLAAITDGYSGADIVSVCRDAAMVPMRRLLSNHSITELQKKRADGTLEISAINKEDFDEAIKKTKPSISAETVIKYDNWNKVHGSTN